MMTASELTTCRNLLDMLQDCNGEVADYWGRMLEHIDDQANQIAKLTEETDCTEIYESLESAGIDMGDNEQPQDIVTAIEILVSQIVTLKAALISERNRYLVDFIHEYDDVRDCKEEAKEQLAKEYPEIDWEE